jgi:hypothetical protein
MMSQLEPLRFWSRAKGAERTDDPVTWATLGRYRLNQQMIGLSSTAERAFGLMGFAAAIVLLAHT